LRERTGFLQERSGADREFRGRLIKAGCGLAKNE
jgi:hypothetical protein